MYYHLYCWCRLLHIMYLRLIVSLFLNIDDHSRVRLEEIPNTPGSDYINANFIDVSIIFLYLLVKPNLSVC